MPNKDRPFWILLGGSLLLLTLACITAIVLCRPRIVFGEFNVGGSLDLPADASAKTDWNRFFRSKEFSEALIAKLKNTGDRDFAACVSDGRISLRHHKGLHDHEWIEFSSPGYSLISFDPGTLSFVHGIEPPEQSDIQTNPPDDLWARVLEKNESFRRCLSEVVADHVKHERRISRDD